MARSKPGAADGSITGADFLQLSIADAPPGRRAAWLADRLRTAVADGRLPLGSRLPASRVLAAELRVSRGVVTEAYQRLVEDGHVEGRGRAGTVVVAVPFAAADGAAVPTAGGAFAAAAFPVAPAGGAAPGSAAMLAAPVATAGGATVPAAGSAAAGGAAVPATSLRGGGRSGGRSGRAGGG